MTLSIRFYILLVCLLAYSSSVDARAPFSSERAAYTAQNAASPLMFIANKGQVTDQHGKARTDIDYKLQTRDINIFIGDGALHYQWTKIEAAKNNAIKEREFSIYRLDMKLQGANANAVLQSEEADGYYETYYLPQTPGGVTAHAAKKLVYKNIYPNIDWVIYTSSAHLKYDFILHPGADITDIKLVYEGADNISIQDKGSVRVKTMYGSITEDAPVSYETDTHQPVPVDYLQDGNSLGFRIKGNVQPQQGMVIDPGIDWATYVGGTGVDYGYTVAIDTASNVYVGGSTQSSSNIATNGSHNNTYIGNQDAYVAKYSKTGAKIWATYYGGLGADDFFSSVTDDNNNVYLAGITYSSSGIAFSGWQGSYNGGSGDVFMVKFNPAGQRQWGTYFGTSGDEQSSTDYQAGLAIDGNNNIYLCGNTNTGGLSYNAIHQSSVGGGKDGFLAKFSNNCVLQWCTYYGGPDNDRIVKVATDASNNVYAYGETYSNSGISSGTGMYQNTYGGSADAFIAKFSQAGARQWATYFGGPDDDNPEGFGVDKLGNIYISGSTGSATGIATSGSYMSALAGNVDIFLAKFNSSAALQWATYYGGSSIDHSGDLGFDPAGNICLTGSSASSTGISAGQNFQPRGGGSFDAFLSIFSPAGDCNWASYFGGTDNDYGYGIRCDKNGDIRMTGYTASDYLASPNALQTSIAGSQDALLVKLKIDTSAYIIQPFTLLSLCASDTFSVYYNVTNAHLSGNVFSVQLSSPNGSFTTPSTIGSVVATAAGRVFCTLPSTASGTGYRIRIVSSVPYAASPDNGLDMVIRTAPANPTASSNSPICGGGNLALTSGTSSSGVSFSWSGPGGFSSTQQNPTINNAPASATGTYSVRMSLGSCEVTSTINATVGFAPAKPVSSYNYPCEGDNLLLTTASTTPGCSYSWTGPGFTSNNAKDSVVKTTTAAAGRYIAKAFILGCASTDTINVQLKPLPARPSIIINNPVCTGDTLHFSSQSATQNALYSWSGPANYTSNLQTNNIYNFTTANAGMYVAFATYANCTSSDTTYVQAIISPTPPTVTQNGPLCEGDTLYLHTTGGVNGAVYSWTGPDNFKAVTPDAAAYTLPPTATGDYILSMTAGGCTVRSITYVVVTPTPPRPKPTYNAPVCTGATLNLGLKTIATNANYVWTKQPSYYTVSTGPSIANVTLNDSGDYIVIANIAGCYSKADTLHVVITPALLPGVNLAITPGTHLTQDGTQVDFKATPVNGGSSPKWQWMKNGSSIPGLTGDSYSGKMGMSFSDGDVICVNMVTSATCVNPTSIIVCADTFRLELGVNNVLQENELALYPNPNTGSFTISGPLPTGDHIISVTDVLGRLVYSRNVHVMNNTLQQDIDMNAMPAGVYMLRVHAVQADRILKFTVY